MNHNQSKAFNTLLSTWVDHQDLRQAKAPLADLAVSRVRLDSARMMAHHAR